MLDKIITMPKWAWILLGFICFFMIVGWFPFVFVIVYAVTIADIFVESAPLVLKLSVAVCFIVPLVLRVVLPESAKNMLYFLIPVAFMTALAYSVELDMANVADHAIINNYMQPLFCNVLPVVIGLLLGWFVKNTIEEIKRNKEK